MWPPSDAVASQSRLVCLLWWRHESYPAIVGRYRRLGEGGFCSHSRVFSTLVQKTRGPGATDGESVVVTAMTGPNLKRFIASPRIPNT